MTVTYPSEIIELPSKGWFYAENNPLSSGKLDVKYLTAAEEDILTSTNLIQRGVVLDKLMEALIKHNVGVKYEDLLLGDKNGLIIAARILGYGKDYNVTISCPNCSAQSTNNINLEDIKEKDVPFLPEQKGINEFSYTLPFSKASITFKLLTHGDEKNVTAEIQSMKKISRSDVTAEVTTRMRKSIISVNGNREPQAIREFVNAMPAKDAMAFREHAKAVNPDIDLTFDFECLTCGHEQRMEVPIDITFFWPNAKI